MMGDVLPQDHESLFQRGRDRPSRCPRELLQYLLCFVIQSDGAHSHNVHPPVIHNVIHDQRDVNLAMRSLMPATIESGATSGAPFIV
jgi:hypothetical protein